MSFIFVGGYMHSGTTMLQKILSKHSSIFGIPYETRLFEYWSHSQHIKNLNEISKKLNERLHFGVNQDKCIRKDSLIDYWSCMFEGTNASYVAEKTPTNIYFCSEILEQFGETAKIVLIYRSPFQVLASKKERLTEKSFSRYKSNDMRARKKLEKDFDIFLDSLSWRKAFNIANTRRGNSQIHTINYSEFVLDPISEGKRLFEFLGLTFEPKVLELDSANSASISDTKIKGVSAIRLDKYKSILTRRELAQISFLCQNELKILGEDLVKWSFLDVALLYVNSVFGLVRRVYKRFKMYSLSDFYLHGRNYLKRISS